MMSHNFVDYIPWLDIYCSQVTGEFSSELASFKHPSTSLNAYRKIIQCISVLFIILIQLQSYNEYFVINIFWLCTFWS